MFVLAPVQPLFVSLKSPCCCQFSITMIKCDVLIAPGLIWPWFSSRIVSTTLKGICLDQTESEIRHNQLLFSHLFVFSQAIYDAFLVFSHDCWLWYFQIRLIITFSAYRTNDYNHLAVKFNDTTLSPGTWVLIYSSTRDLQEHIQLAWVSNALICFQRGFPTGELFLQMKSTFLSR